MKANRDYVADHRLYGATGKVTGGGWCIMRWDGKRQTWEEGAPYAIKSQAMISMREEHARSSAARALGSIRTAKKARSSAENGGKGDPESHRKGGRRKGKKE